MNAEKTRLSWWWPLGGLVVGAAAGAILGNATYDPGGFEVVSRSGAIVMGAFALAIGGLVAGLSLVGLSVALLRLTRRFRPGTDSSST